jgi:hypothetical protein
MLPKIRRVQPITIPIDPLNFMISGQWTSDIIAHDILVCEHRGALFIREQIRQPRPHTPRRQFPGWRQRDTETQPGE